MRNPVLKRLHYVTLALVLFVISSPGILFGQVTTYPFPEGALQSYRYEVTVNGENSPVYMGHGAHFTQFAFDGDTARVVVKVIHGSYAWWVNIRPLENNISNLEAGVSTVSFDICDTITQLSLEFNGHTVEPLFIFANPLERVDDVVDKHSDDMYYFGPGVHNPGVITLTEQKKKVFIDGGAYVKGTIQATDLDGVQIFGRGILSGEMYHNRPLDSEWHNLIAMKGCTNVEIKDIIMYSSVAWNILLLLSDHVNIYNVKKISSTGNSDGVDVCGSNHVTVDHCFMYLHDDCIAFNNLVSCFNYTWGYGSMRPNSTNTRFTNSILWNMVGGVPIKIGWNTMAEHHSNIVFENIDIIHCERGAAIEMNFGDAGSYRNVIFNNIRIEDVPQFLNFNMFGNTTTIDPHRGTSEANGFHFKNIFIKEDLCNNTNRMRGMNPINAIKNVSFQNINFKNSIAEDIEGLNLDTSYVESIIFSDDTTPPSTPEIKNITSGNPYEVVVSWDRSFDPETEIIHYNVYRDGMFLNISKNNEFIDHSCKPQTKYTYSVSAINAVGLESIQSKAKEITTGNQLNSWKLSDFIDGNTQGYGQFYYLTYNKIPLKFYRMPDSGYEPISREFVQSTFRFWDMYFDGIDTWHSVSHAKRASDIVIDAQLTNECVVIPHKDMDIAIGWKAPFDGKFKLDWIYNETEQVNDGPSLMIAKNSYENVLFSHNSEEGIKQQNKQDGLELNLKKDDFIFCIISSQSSNYENNKMRIDVMVSQL